MSNASLAPLAVLQAGLAILLVILYRQRQVRVLSTSFALPWPSSARGWQI
jgi:hypothetical protein